MGSEMCIRDRKMVIGRKNKIPELYNLQDDLGETSNMAEEKPELIKEMLKEMESWKKHVDFNLLKE